MERRYFVVVFVVLLASFVIKINGATPSSRSQSEINRLLPTPEDGCGYAKVKNTRIIGGSEAPIGAWPWMALLISVKPNKILSYDCGGSLITSKHVLTAAHCVLDNPSLKFARLGEHDVRSAYDGMHDDVPIIRPEPHEEYDNKTKIHDIAILHLERAVKFTDRIRPICLPTAEPLRSRVFTDQNPFVAGWGKLSEFPFHNAAVLMQVQVPVVNNMLCRALYFVNSGFQIIFDKTIRKSTICAGWIEGKGVWKGDSGGPLMLPVQQNGSFPFYQIGIVSSTIGAAKKHKPSLYTKVQYYIDWIVDKISV